MSVSRLKYIVELAAFFLFLPLIYYYNIIPGFWKFLPILFFFGYCLGLLLINKAIKTNDFLLSGISSSFWLRIVISSLIIGLGLWLTGPQEKFADFSNPRILLAVICYPVFSSLPQELIFRKFFFWRYGSLLKSNSLMVLLNGLLFSFAHLYFGSVTALVITFVGGVVFAYSLLKTNSLLFVTIEHAIYGLILLSSYMNDHFYKAF